MPDVSIVVVGSMDAGLLSKFETSTLLVAPLRTVCGGELKEAA